MSAHLPFGARSLGAVLAVVVSIGGNAPVTGQVILPPGPIDVIHAGALVLGANEGARLWAARLDFAPGSHPPSRVRLFFQDSEGATVDAADRMLPQLRKAQLSIFGVEHEGVTLQTRVDVYPAVAGGPVEVRAVVEIYDTITGATKRWLCPSGVALSNEAPPPGTESPANLGRFFSDVFDLGPRDEARVHLVRRAGRRSDTRTPLPARVHVRVVGVEGTVLASESRLLRPGGSATVRLPGTTLVSRLVQAQAEVHAFDTRAGCEPEYVATVEIDRLLSLITPPVCTTDNFGKIQEIQ